MPRCPAALPPGFVWVERGEIAAVVEAELEPALRASPLLAPGGFESLLEPPAIGNETGSEIGTAAGPGAGRGAARSAEPMETHQPAAGSPEPVATRRDIAGSLEPAATRRGVPGSRESVATGRGRTAVLTLKGVDGAERRLLLRPVLHGGLLGPLLGGALAGLRRPLEELTVTEALRRAGAPVPRPALCVARRVRGPVFRAAVATYLEEGTVDAAGFLTSRPERPRMLRAAAALGAGVRRFHDAGGRHADLHVKNLLLREHAGGFDALVIDLDRARTGSPANERRRMRELMRLYRSLRKRDLAATVGPRGCARFLAAYVQGDRALRRALLAHLPRERLRLSLHSLAYPRHDRPRKRAQKRGRW